MNESYQWCKCLLIFVVFCLAGSPSQAAQVMIRPPAEVLVQVETIFKDARFYDDESVHRYEMKVTRWIGLDLTRVVIMVELPTYLNTCNHFLPISAGLDGTWEVGRLMEGNLFPALFGLGSDDHFWQVSHWIVEGVFPMLFRSRNGFAWDAIRLPSVGPPFEYLDDLCLTDDEVRIGLRGTSIPDDNNETEKRFYFAQPLAKVTADRGDWRPIGSDQVLSAPDCHSPAEMHHGWSMDENDEELLFCQADGCLLWPRFMTLK